MKKQSTAFYTIPGSWYFFLGLIIILGVAYGRLILQPGLHIACPENDTWNFPIRWSVLSSLDAGRIPLWNSLSAFGIPWLATWQTECFYPGTLLFTWLGLSAWNLSGLLHLFILSAGIFSFLKQNKIDPFWAFFSASLALLNGCAYNHLGSNSSMDTMAWIPWMLLATQLFLEQKPWSGFLWALFFALQVLAGYPQIIFYTLTGCFAYAAFLKGWPAILRLTLPLIFGLLISSAQWISSIEYFFINAVRLPAVHDNPHFFLPLENLKTFLDFNALGKGDIPDYVLNPTFFYFNFYSGLLPLAALIFGILRLKKLQNITRFFLLGFVLWLLWALGLFLAFLGVLHIPYPASLEPAKSWVLINVFELFSVGLILGDLFPRPSLWKWGVWVIALLNLFWPIWTHPLERNMPPEALKSDSESRTLLDHVGSRRLLILPNADEHHRLYTPLPDPQNRPFFKHFVPNSNLLVGLSSATFYGSTQPSWGALDAGFYFQYGFPYEKGKLLDLLGARFIYLPENHMPPRFEPVEADGAWTLWHLKRPSVPEGESFYFCGKPQVADRKQIFEAFASGSADPAKNLFLDPQPISTVSSRHNSPFLESGHEGDTSLHFLGGGLNHCDHIYLVVRENAMPGWRAWVDGIPHDIFLADGIFQAVDVEKPGRQVELAYEPASFRFGLFISLLTLAGLGGWFAFRKSNRLGF